MRNFPVEDYFYKLVKIINPFESEIDQGPIQDPGKTFVQFKPAMANSYNGIECFTDKSIYKQREKVELTVLLENHAMIIQTFVSLLRKPHI